MLKYEFLRYRLVNGAFTLLCFGLAPWAGSAVTVVFLAGAMWCILHIAFGRPSLSSDESQYALFVPLLGYCLASAVSTAANADSGSEAALRMVPLMTFLVMPFSYSIWSISEKSTIALMGVIGSILACYGALITALVQFYWLDIRAEGGAGNPLVFALVTCIAGAVALSGLALERRGLTLAICLAWLSAFLAITFSEARTVWLTFLVVSAVVLWLNRASLTTGLTVPRGSRWVMVVSCVATVAAILLACEIIFQRWELAISDWRLALAGNFDTAVGQRIAMWEIGTDLFSRRPFLGYGLDSAKSLLGHALPAAGVSTNFTHFHNGMLTVAVESGGVGLAFLVTFFAVGLVIASRVFARASSPVERVGATILLVTMLVYFLSGMTNLIVGHDILDAVLMICVIVGVYLGDGTSSLTTRLMKDDSE